MFVSASCEGERCRCGEPAQHKVEETIFWDDPVQGRHPLTAYICHRHFVELMGAAAEIAPQQFDRVVQRGIERGWKSE